MRYVSLTSWSLNRLLGPLYWSKWNQQKKDIETFIDEQPEIHSLLDLPALLAEKGFQAMEIIHPHVPSTDTEYLKKLHKATQKAGIRFYNLLIDYGDITNEDPVRRKRDMDFIKSWIDIASKVGAENVRVIGGDAKPDDKKALQLAALQLMELCAYAKKKGVGVLTENFHSLTSTSENCLFLYEQTDITGLISDFGNFSGPSKFQSLSETIPNSTSIHVKALSNKDGSINKSELLQCLDLVEQANYDGPLTIVYDGPNDMWQGIEEVKEIVQRYII
ncbi:sugar phosphate isomerase/epimerase family protein [Alkalicoccobacillus murimartini]|uniref:Xylose isomerase-like TIM barrel domain-containing protein n=1 Tax=Alkalicoccobacillus murimartini TaxID=171685 RepID=A0ABT9YHX8_9BACI|nr:sugar phosphate isomerase/epimerase [Alkalicoccobacillus murimartini]MDQ0207311.1 hypothetical protein [Alkalicoccobacillus murimartini]